MSKIKVKLIGKDGNIFNLIGIVSKEMRRSGLDEQAKEMTSRILGSESYDDALQIIMEYVDVY